MRSGLGGNKKVALGVSALALAVVLGGVLYATDGDEAPEGGAPAPVSVREQVGNPAPASPPAATPPPIPAGSESTALSEAASPESGAPLPTPTLEAASRPRSLTALRGGVSQALRGCSSRNKGDVVRVFVSMTARVEGGRLVPEGVRVQTSSPAREDFVRCVTDAVQRLSLRAPPDEPPGSFPVTVSLLTGSS